MFKKIFLNQMAIIFELAAIALFVCFSLIWRRHHCRWRAANFDLCFAHMVIEKWGFYSVPHLLRHGASIYNGHLRGPVTLTPISKRLAVELLLPCFFQLSSVAAGIQIFNLPPAKRTLYPQRYRRSCRHCYLKTKR